MSVKDPQTITDYHTRPLAATYILLETGHWEISFLEFILEFYSIRLSFLMTIAIEIRDHSPCTLRVGHAIVVVMLIVAGVDLILDT